MSALRDAIDFTTLGWIKPELDETLRQARIEIEAFAEDPSDTSRMLRNAVAHGLESPEQRRKANKPDEGVVRIAVRREGSEVVLEVGDDGMPKTKRCRTACRRACCSTRTRPCCRTSNASRR